MDHLFLQFARGLFIILILFGMGMITVILFGDTAVGVKMINAFVSMFAGALGLGSGYILGRGSRQMNGNGKEDLHDRT